MANKPFWKTPSPEGGGGKLSDAQKKAAKARAARAGRRYPNLVDNAWATKRGK
jgi:hypothetical protein